MNVSTAGTLVMYDRYCKAVELSEKFSTIKEMA